MTIQQLAAENALLRAALAAITPTPPRPVTATDYTPAQLSQAH